MKCHSLSCLLASLCVTADTTNDLLQRPDQLIDRSHRSFIAGGSPRHDLYAHVSVPSTRLYRSNFSVWVEDANRRVFLRKRTMRPRLHESRFSDGGDYWREFQTLA